MTLEEQHKEDALERFCDTVTSGFALVILRAILASDINALMAIYSAMFLSSSANIHDGERLQHDLYLHLTKPLSSGDEKDPSFSWSPQLKLLSVKALKEDGTIMHVDFRPPVCGGSVRVISRDFNVMSERSHVEVADPQEQLQRIAAVVREGIIEHMRIQDRMR